MNKNCKASIKIDQDELDQIEDKENGNTDVYVTLEDGFILNITVATPKNLEFLMVKDKINFCEPGPNWIIVQKLTPEIINEAIEAYLNDRPDAYWLKLFYFGSDIPISVFDQLQAEEIKGFKEDQVIHGLDQLKNKIDKYPESFKKEDILASINELYQFLDTEPL